MRSLKARLGWLGLLIVLALLSAGCQRTLVFIETPEGNPLGPSPTPERSAAILEITGQVEARRSSEAEWAPAQPGQVLSEGSQLRTGAGARVSLQLTEGTKIYAGPDTTFTFNLLNPFLDSQLTALALEAGQVWVLLSGGALDVETPLGIATARGAYIGVRYQPQGRDLEVTCLQGVCGFGSVLIPSGYKLANAATNSAPEPMGFADYGAWGVTVPEATQFAYLATEAVVEGNATLPVVEPATETHTPAPTVTPRPTITPRPSFTPSPTVTSTPVPNQPTDTPPPTATPIPSSTPVPPTQTPLPSPTLPVFQPTVTRPPFTPIPPAPIIGRHTVLPGETLFCIARGYGVQPTAIAQANGLPSNANIRSGQVLAIPQVRWVNISAGPVCAPQFASPFPGLPVATPTSPATPTQAGPPLVINVNYFCTGNCGSSEGDYTVHFDVTVSGGVPPYGYNPGASFDLTFPHCTDGSGLITVTSADGQVVTQAWFYKDVSCPN
jgi:LysM repeat protein